MRKQIKQTKQNKDKDNEELKCVICDLPIKSADMTCNGPRCRRKFEEYMRSMEKR